MIEAVWTFDGTAGWAVVGEDCHGSDEKDLRNID
jgi:hypothetical protein